MKTKELFIIGEKPKDIPENKGDNIIMDPEKEAIIKLLDDYYGDDRTREQKEEIAEFIESYFEPILKILI